MKMCIASHIVLDTIRGIDGIESESLGGPACYGSLIAKTFNFDVHLATKIGYDFNRHDLLELYGISVKEHQIDKNNSNTKFKLILDADGSRKLFLLSKCSGIPHVDIMGDDSDGIILSPVFDEISEETLQMVLRERKGNKFIMLDPQGFLRIWNKNDSSISFKKTLDLDFRGITCIKADEDELSALTNGTTSIEGMKKLQKKYELEFVISTGHNKILLLHKNIVYMINLRKIDSPDHTGLGDILATGFSCSYIKEKDPLWAICFGAGSVISALENKKKGLEKIPRKINLIERNASYFYNSVKFKIVD